MLCIARACREAVKGKAGKSGGHLLERSAVGAGEVLSGMILDWKGNYGWISPLEPIAHAKASRNGGRVPSASIFCRFHCAGVKTGDGDLASIVRFNSYP